MSTSEGAAPVAGEQQHLAWCSAVPSGGWKARCSCGYESDTFYDVATASAYADAHREGAAPPDPKPAQGDPQPAEQQECGTCGGSQSSCPVCHPDDSYERHELAAGRGPAERAPEGGERACIECGRLFSTRNPRHRLCFDCLHAAAPEQDAEPGGVAFWRAEVAEQDAEDEALLDRFRELAAFCELRGADETAEMDRIESALLARLRAARGAGQAPAEQDPRQRAADAIGCEVDEVDDDPRLAEITAAVYAETGPATLGPLVFAVTTNGDVGVWSEDQPVGEDVPCLGAGNTATHALQRMYRRLLHPTPLPAAPAGEQGEALLQCSNPECGWSGRLSDSGIGRHKVPLCPECDSTAAALTTDAGEASDG